MRKAERSRAEAEIAHCEDILAKGRRRRTSAAPAATARQAPPGREPMRKCERCRAEAEIAHCEDILAKGGLSVLSETFRDAAEVRAWDHYPAGDVFDPSSGAQWFYH